jgi:hypothetical protein
MIIKKPGKEVPREDDYYGAYGYGDAPGKGNEYCGRFIGEGLSTGVAHQLKFWAYEFQGGAHAWACEEAPAGVGYRYDSRGIAVQPPERASSSTSRKIVHSVRDFRKCYAKSSWTAEKTYRDTVWDGLGWAVTECGRRVKFYVSEDTAPEGPVNCLACINAGKGGV